MKQKTKVICSMICAASFFFTFSLSVQASPKAPNYHRFHGQDRFETSISVANALNTDQQVQNIVLASAYSFPDALAASTLASQLKAPIILAGHGVKDSQATLSYVKEHLIAGGTVTITGGAGVISKHVEQWLLDSGFKVTRLGGRDRFATNDLIVKQLNVAKGTPVILTNAENFPDALGISSLAASKGWPILLSNPGTLPQSVQDFLSTDKPTTVYVVGGEGVMRQSVLNQIQTLAPGTHIERLGGNDRFETLSKILNTFYPSPTQIYIANGYEFADALAGSPLAAAHNAPILLVNPNGNHLPQSITDYLITLRNNNVQPQVNVLGGEGAVPQRLLDQIDDILQSNGTTTNPATTNETFTVSNSSTAGFTLNMYPALNGLTTNNFTLLDSYGNSVALNSAYTSDNGVTYTLSAALNEGQTYTVIASRTGYNFVTAPKVVVPSASTTNETLIVSNPSTTGFTVTVSPALMGLTVHDFKLMDSTTSVAITSASVSNSGATYQLAANLTAGKTYTVTAEKSGYNFGTVSYVVVPSAPTVSSAVTSDSWHIVLTMNRQLMGTIGDPEAFNIAGVASNPTVTRVTVSGSTVTLTLSAPIVNTDSFVKVSYTKTGINNLTNGAPVANVYLLAVTNNVE